jgi:small subunit ribosomal protein S7
MPRKKIKKQKKPIFDPFYNSSFIAKLINYVMLHGKKALAEKIVYGAMDTIKEKTGEDPLKYVLAAIENVKPITETRSRRVGGATYQVPMEVRKERAYALSIRWIVQSAKGRSGRTFTDKLVNELMDAFEKKGNAFKKREVTHKMADANRAFAHYKW